MRNKIIIIFFLFILSICTMCRAEKPSEEISWISLEQLDNQDEWEPLERSNPDSQGNSVNAGEVIVSVDLEEPSEVLNPPEVLMVGTAEDGKNMEENSVAFRYSLLFDPLRLAIEDDDWTQTVEAQLESTITDKISIVLIGLYSFLTSERNYLAGKYNRYGFGGGMRYYPAGETGSQCGFWLGPKATAQFGRYAFETVSGYSSTLDDTILTVGAEAGFKWFVGRDVGIVISPYAGYYYMTVQYPDEDYLEKLEHDYFFMGIYIGMGF
ncbi:DUF3575 domain-containing protein [bacterium]|nr:DUF3575 domain-containing protein [bacterium]